MADVRKLERLLNLVAVLMAATEPVPFSQIRGRVIGYDDVATDDALDKRFERDKRELRQIGIEVEYVEAHHNVSGYVIRSERMTQRETEFTCEEAVLLTMAGRLGEVATGGGVLGEALKSALRKLSVDLPDCETGAELSALTVLRAHCASPHVQNSLAALALAVASSKRVRFTYDSASSLKAVREVDPYGLGMVRGAWYVVGHCHLRQEIRTFKLVRILGNVQRCVPESGSDFMLPDEFSLHRHLSAEGWEPVDASLTRVVLRMAAAGTPAELPGGARLIKTDGCVQVFELSVRRTEELVPWILARTGRVSVEEPEALRQSVCVAARALLERHHDPVTQALVASAH